MSEEAKKLAAQIEAVKHQIAAANERSGIEWEIFNDSQKDLPSASRLTYDAWFAQTWGLKISTLETHYSILTTQRTGAVQKDSKHD